MQHKLNIFCVLFIQISQLRELIKHSKYPERIFDITNSLYEDMLRLKQPSLKKLRDLKAFLRNFKGDFKESFVMSIDLYFKAIEQKCNHKK